MVADIDPMSFDLSAFIRAIRGKAISAASCKNQKLVPISVH
jgi:hypothetical protein